MSFATAPVEILLTLSEALPAYSDLDPKPLNSPGPSECECRNAKPICQDQPVPGFLSGALACICSAVAGGTT